MKLARKFLFYAVIVQLVFLNSCKNVVEKEVTDSLPRSIPEVEGVSSQGIITFLDSVAKSRHEFHSIMILRHGKVIAEGWWSPYAPNLRHTLYSTSKSFTSTAIGFAVSENLLKVTDKVVSFFPEFLPDTVSPYLADLMVKDLLTMSVGQDPDPTFSLGVADTNWVRFFLTIPIVNKPGTKFLYNSMATYMLSAIVQKVTGEKTIEYLKPRLFEPLKIAGMDWEEDPRGINTGGWGLRIKTEDMAKFGQLYLQNGMWNNKQILSEEWVKEATTFKIDQAPGALQSKKDSSDWMQGYCYQFWRCRNNAFRADGAYGQYIIVMPEKDAVIAITSESPDMQSALNMVWDFLLPAMKENKLSENKALYDSLTKKLANLSLPLAQSSLSGIESEISERTFRLDENTRKLESLTCVFSNDACRMILKTNETEYNLNFGKGKWTLGETDKRGPGFISSGNTLQSSVIAGNYSWKNNNTIEFVLRYIESPHTEKFLCRFEKNNVILTILNSNDFGKNFTEIKGRAESNIKP